MNSYSTFGFILPALFSFVVVVSGFLAALMVSFSGNLLELKHFAMRVQLPVVTHELHNHEIGKSEPKSKVQGHETKQTSWKALDIC